ncbi:TPA: restriction endonuclease subunit S [Streptococcus suis]
MNNNIPAYRFPGYTDAWEQRKLGEVIEQQIREVDKPNDAYRRLSVRSHAKGTFHQLVEDPSTVAMDKLYIVKADDLIVNITFAWEHAIAVANLYDDGLLVSHRFPTYRAKFNSDITYIKYLVSQEDFRRKLEFISPGGAGRNRVMNKKDFINLKAVFPTLPEQEAIGSFFSVLDQLITLHQRKLDTLKEQKKTYLKLLFPAKGQTKPALRFQGFKDDWEKVKLGEIGETFTGLSGKTKEDFGHGEGKFITYVNVFNNPISDLLGTDRIEVDESQTNVQFGDIFFTTSSETPEEVGMSSVWLGNGNNIYLNSFCFGFRPTLKLSNHFMAYVLRSTEIRKKFIFLAQGISRYNISKTKVMNISIPLPSLPEQQAIGTFFQTIDREIAQVEDKLASLKEMKKTLLRKLFV